MDVDAITIALLTQTLRAWQQGRPLPPDLLALDFLAEDPAISPLERSFALQDRITALVSSQLVGLRAAEGLPATDPRAATRRAALDALQGDFRAGSADLQGWSALYHRYLCLLPFRHEELAAAIPLDPRSLRRHLNHGLARLAEALQRLELEAHGRSRARARARHLPPADYTQLFGIAAHQARLASSLRRPDGPAVISIEGLGGIGKTALARVVALDLAHDSPFDSIAWISARQTWLTPGGEMEALPDPATTLGNIAARLAAQLGLSAAAGLSTTDKLAQIAELLYAAPHLIVIDNLESVREVETLLPALLPLAGASRFLLTSRHALSHYPLVHRTVVPPLSLADSHALVEAELARHGRPARLASAGMESLYATLGGMPLALKLVAAQIGHWPLTTLLDGLRAAAAGPPQGLYTYIYRRTWLALDDPARRLLLSLLTVSPDGDDLSWLRLVSLLDDTDFDPALAALLSYSLLETAGSLAAPTYRLHRLTATFLQSEILSNWDSPAPPEP